MSIALSKRERLILICTIALVAAAGLYYWPVKPMLDQRQQMHAENQALTIRLARQQKVLGHRRELGPLWTAMQPSLKETADQAESQAMHTLRDAAAEARLSPPSYRPERLLDESAMPQVSVKVDGAGTMQSVTRFLYLLDSAEIPLRMTELTMTSKKPGGDEINFTLRVTTIYKPIGHKPAPRVANAKPVAEVNL
jgi:hypothetical protein